MTERSGKVATPCTAVTVAVPLSAPPPGFEPSATVTAPVKLVRVAPEASCAAIHTAGAIAVPAVVADGAPSTPSRVGGSAVRKFAPLELSGTQALTRPVWSTVRACQRYATSSVRPSVETRAAVPEATGALEAVATLENAVPTARTSTSSRTWSPGSGSVIVAPSRTMVSSVTPPSTIAVVPSLRRCTRRVGATGASGTATTKSAAPAAFPPKVAQALARPVASTARTCQW